MDDRKRVLALPDRMDWALGFICQDLAEALDSTHDITVEQCPKVLDESLAEKYDIIYVAYVQQYIKVPKALRPRTVTGIHSYLEYHGSRMRTFSHRMKQYAAAGVLAPQMKKDVCHLNGRIFWTPYGIPSEFSPSESETLTMPADKLRVGWAGNPNWGGRRYMKNFDVLKRTAARMKDTVDLRVTVDIPRSGMPDFYRGLDVLVVSSRSEGGPLPLMEALCCGVPVVTTHVGLADVHIQHGHNGWFFDGDDAGLARRLKWLARNPAALADAGHAATATPFIRWPEVAAHWRAFFDSVT